MLLRAPFVASVEFKDSSLFLRLSEKAIIVLQEFAFVKPAD